MPRLGELRLDGGELIAQLARMIELFLQGGDQGVRFAQREEARLRQAVHGGTVHDGATRSSGDAEATNRPARARRPGGAVLRSAACCATSPSTNATSTSAGCSPSGAVGSARRG